VLQACLQDYFSKITPPPQKSSGPPLRLVDMHRWDVQMSQKPLGKNSFYDKGSDRKNVSKWISVEPINTSQDCSGFTILLQQ